MQAKTIIAALQELDPEAEVMAQWFTKEDVEGNNKKTYSDEHWDLAVRLFDKWETGQDDLGVNSCIDEAEARLGDDK